MDADRLRKAQAETGQRREAVVFAARQAVERDRDPAGAPPRGRGSIGPRQGAAVLADNLIRAPQTEAAAPPGLKRTAGTGFQDRPYTLF